MHQILALPPTLNVSITLPLLFASAGHQLLFGASDAIAHSLSVLLTHLEESGFPESALTEIFDTGPSPPQQIADLHNDLVSLSPALPTDLLSSWRAARDRLASQQVAFRLCLGCVDAAPNSNPDPSPSPSPNPSANPKPNPKPNPRPKPISPTLRLA